MAKILVYSAPSRAHLYPMVPALQQLNKDGHEVIVYAPRAEERNLCMADLNTYPLSDEVECTLLDDWNQSSHENSVTSMLHHRISRGPAEAANLIDAIRTHKPQAVFIDACCFGAAAFAEGLSIPASFWSTCLLPFPRQGIPPFGLGLAKAGTFGALKNWGKAAAVQKNYDLSLKDLNAMRADQGGQELYSVLDWPSVLPNLLYFTAEPFEYKRNWPENVIFAGAGTWEPDFPEVDLSGNDDRPIILVSLSCEYQHDIKIAQATLDNLNPKDYRIIITTAAENPDSLPQVKGVEIMRLARHTPIMRKAVCLICPGNLGTTQKALSCGLPVLAVPMVRDQLEVAQRLKSTRSGYSITPEEIDNMSFPKAVQKAISCKSGAQEMQKIFASIDTVAIVRQTVNKMLTLGSSLVEGY